MGENKVLNYFFGKRILITFGIILAFFFLIWDTLSIKPGFARIGFPFIYRTVDTSGFAGFTPEFYPIFLVLNIVVYYLASVAISFLFNKRN